MPQKEWRMSVEGTHRARTCSCDCGWHTPAILGGDAQQRAEQHAREFPGHVPVMRDTLTIDRSYR